MEVQTFVNMFDALVTFVRADFKFVLSSRNCPDMISGTKRS